MEGHPNNESLYRTIPEDLKNYRLEELRELAIKVYKGKEKIEMVKDKIEKQIDKTDFDWVESKITDTQKFIWYGIIITNARLKDISY